MCLNTELKQQKYVTVHTHAHTHTQAQDWHSYFPASQEQEISWMKLIMAQSVTAHVLHIRTCYARSQEVTLILQKHTQSHPGKSKHAQADIQKKTHTGTYIHTQNSQMFALQGQEITCVCRRSGTCNTLQVHTHGSFMCVCVCLPVRVFASLWIGVYLSSIKPDQSLSRVPHHRDGVSLSAVSYYCMD